VANEFRNLLLLSALFAASALNPAWGEEGTASSRAKPLHPVPSDSFTSGIAGRVHAHQQRTLQTPGRSERNAIGQPVILRNNAEQSGLEKPVPQLAPQLSPAANGTADFNNGKRTLGAPEIVHTNPMRTVANHSAVDGQALIRPVSTPSPLGGPAKPITGINGSTVRLKR
jgi:hypothetical protein